MALSEDANKLISELTGETLKLGDLKKHAKQIKQDQKLAVELWSTGNYNLRLLSILIVERKFLTQQTIEQLAAEMLEHDETERNQIADWLLANQLMKNKRLSNLVEAWEEEPSAILRRLFWYHQARLRWTGKKPPENTEYLLDSLKKSMANAEPGVQWAMNFCAGQIGIHEPNFRNQSVKLGERIGLYKNSPVARNCTPSYLPDFIHIEVEKLA
jgi:3-methyladenine DNA glycosylase AlkD